MNPKSWIWIGAFVGGSIGAYLPALWGDSSLFSMSSIFFSMVGGLAGIWAGFKMGQMF